MEILEEKLREAACLGDIKTVENLIKENININSRQKANGWYETILMTYFIHFNSVTL